MKIRRTFLYVQTNTGNIKEVFPLLCPVKEKDKDNKMEELEHAFLETMHYWEKAINYYLEKGKLLERKSIKA